MSLATYEGIVIDGLIRLPAGIRLRDESRVYVLVPDRETETVVHRLASPRLASPADAADFVMEIDELSDDRRLTGCRPPRRRGSSALMG